MAKVNCTGHGIIQELGQICLRYELEGPLFFVHLRIFLDVIDVTAAAADYPSLYVKTRLCGRRFEVKMWYVFMIKFNDLVRVTKMLFLIFALGLPCVDLLSSDELFELF